MSRNYLSKNDELRRGDYLISNNGEFKAIFQDDGNFVLYGWRPIWSSNTAGTDAIRLCMQADSNLVMYNEDDASKWGSGSNRAASNMCSLRLSNDGRLVVYREAVPLWTAQ